MLLFLFFLAAVTSGSSSLPVDHAFSCALCQFGSHFLVPLHANGSIYNGVHISQAREQCHKLEGCGEKLTDCEMVQAMSAVIPHEGKEYRALSFALRMISLKCMIEPDSEVMSDFEISTALKCPICHLIYNVFSKINTGLQSSQIINKEIPALVAGVCNYVTVFLGPPALCFPLMDRDVKASQALMRGILDSLGSFYDEIGKPFGCPVWQNLFTECPN